jgi:hypothetical protein
MVSLLHEGVFELVRDHAALVADWLDGVLKLNMRSFSRAWLACARRESR